MLVGIRDGAYAINASPSSNRAYHTPMRDLRTYLTRSDAQRGGRSIGEAIDGDGNLSRAALGPLTFFCPTLWIGVPRKCAR